MPVHREATADRTTSFTSLVAQTNLLESDAFGIRAPTEAPRSASLQHKYTISNAKRAYGAAERRYRTIAENAPNARWYDPWVRMADEALVRFDLD